MCLNPRQIKNPNYGLNHLKFVNTSTAYIEIPCGYCSQCIAIKQMGYAQRILMESINNDLFMLTLTYKESMIPKHATSTGYIFNYADHTDFVNMMKRIAIWKEREQKYTDIPDMRYFAVSELGGLKGRGHIHAIIAVHKDKERTEHDLMNLEHKLYWLFRNEWKRNISASLRHPNYQPLLEYHESWRNGKLYRNYDLHYIKPETTNKGVADAAFYVLKYLLKSTENEENSTNTKRQRALKINLTNKVTDIDYNTGEITGEHNETDWEYYEIWNKIKSKAFYSKYFGLNCSNKNPFGDIEIDKDIYNYIRKCIEFSKGRYEYPVFINPCTGETFPLCKFYRKHLLKGEDNKHFYKQENDAKNSEKGTQRDVKARKGQTIKQIVSRTTEYEQFLKSLDNGN